MNLVFMGSASFALPTLTSLFEQGYPITGVFTQPDKPTGRGQAVQGPPVKQKAFDLHLAIYQPANLKTEDVRELLQALAPDMIIVVAYGKILPRWILELPKFGCVNLHGSLLPKYRGAAPIQWAIAHGETTTGVSTMKIEEGLDTGPVYLSESTPIGPEETVQQLSARLADMGSALMLRTVEGVAKGELSPIPQDDTKATQAPILRREHGFIDWARPAAEIHNRVRGFNPWPGTVTSFRGATCKILKTSPGGPSPEGTEPGTIVSSKKFLGVACGGGMLLEILELQPENRKPVSGADFANGARLQPGEKFETVRDN